MDLSHPVFALSTNWCCRTVASGEEIADRAAALGFGALELGFDTTEDQVSGFRRRLDAMPVGSVHAFCPVPLSAPQGYPELYALANADPDARAIARVNVLKNVRFAADFGADALVLHAGRVPCRGLIARWDMRRRLRRGRALLDVFKSELDRLIPDLERFGVRLGLENLPYLEGFPGEWELKDVCGTWVRPWFDTGHDFVRRRNGWTSPESSDAAFAAPLGLHLNDSRGGDDHLAPGAGQVDFAALKPAAAAADHLVLEPNPSVAGVELVAALARLRAIWSFCGDGIRRGVF